MRCSDRCRLDITRYAGGPTGIEGTPTSRQFARPSHRWVRHPLPSHRRGIPSLTLTAPVVHGSGPQPQPLRWLHPNREGGQHLTPRNAHSHLNLVDRMIRPFVTIVSGVPPIDCPMCPMWRHYSPHPRSAISDLGRSENTWGTWDGWDRRIRCVGSQFGGPVSSRRSSTSPASRRTSSLGLAQVDRPGPDPL